MSNNQNLLDIAEQSPNITICSIAEQGAISSISLIPEISIDKMPMIKSNLSLLKDEMKNFLKKYNFIVSEDGIKVAKAKATELNKMASTLDTLRKEKVKEVSAPIKEFDTEAREIHKMIKATRESLLSQVKKFEEETMQKVEENLSNEVKALFKLYKVESEFQKAQFADLVKISNLTKGGRLTKKASDELQNRVLKDKQLQDIIQARLIALDGICLKAGLETPLQKHNTQHFLFSEDYEEQLNKLIEVELKRQDETKRRIAQQIEDRRKREEQIAQKLQEKEEQKKVSPAQKKPIQKPSISGHKATYTIMVEMELEAADMDVAKLEELTQRKFKKCGFTSIKGVHITKHEQIEENSLIKAGSLF